MARQFDLMDHLIPIAVGTAAGIGLQQVKQVPDWGAVVGALVAYVGTEWVMYQFDNKGPSVEELMQANAPSQSREDLAADILTDLGTEQSLSPQVSGIRR